MHIFRDWKQNVIFYGLPQELIPGKRKGDYYVLKQRVVIPLNTQSLRGLPQWTWREKQKKLINTKIIVVKGIEGANETFAYDAMENNEIIKTFR